ncbi:MAG: methanogenesis marker 9 domain-containing protein [Candidatus Heimdallarchaeota archaeon]
MAALDPEKLRNLPGWENAPIHICMDGDYRGLTFCCKPGYSLTFELKCKRDGVLKELGITSKEFIRIKEKFSKENKWDSDLVCFGSISYCCMRRGGCPRRDPALQRRYPNKSKEEIMEIYYSKKKELSKKILESIKDLAIKKKVKPYLLIF